jgi:hypothetical protein
MDKVQNHSNSECYTPSSDVIRLPILEVGQVNFSIYLVLNLGA